MTPAGQTGPLPHACCMPHSMLLLLLTALLGTVGCLPCPPAYPWPYPPQQHPPHHPLPLPGAFITPVLTPPHPPLPRLGPHRPSSSALLPWHLTLLPLVCPLVPSHTRATQLTFCTGGFPSIAFVLPALLTTAHTLTHAFGLHTHDWRAYALTHPLPIWSWDWIPLAMPYLQPSLPLLDGQLPAHLGLTDSHCMPIISIGICWDWNLLQPCFLDPLLYCTAITGSLGPCLPHQGPYRLLPYGSQVGDTGIHLPPCLPYSQPL